MLLFKISETLAFSFMLSQNGRFLLYSLSGNLLLIPKSCLEGSAAGDRGVATEGRKDPGVAGDDHSHCLYDVSVNTALHLEGCVDFFPAYVLLHRSITTPADDFYIYL